MTELSTRFHALRKALDLIESQIEQETVSQDGLVDLKVAVDNVRGSLLAILTGSHSQQSPTQMAEFRIQRATQLSANIRSDLMLGTLSEDSTDLNPLSDAVSALLEGIRDTQQRRVQSQKMETVGALAGGIAHDFNNILTPIHGYLEMALEDLPPDSATHKDLLDAKRATVRAAQLVRQILAFSSPGDAKKQPGWIQGTVHEAVNLLRASLPASVELKVAVDEDCPPVLADQIQVHQVVMNLGTNAYHAMRERGGSLTIRLEPHTVSPEGDAALVPGPYVKLSVIDTGDGMTEETLDRLFEPFFTTKKASQGTGLGLAVVRGIVKEHDGEITVQSAPGIGSTFSVFLPAVDVPQERSGSAHDDLAAGEGRILLVEDDVSIVRMLRKQLVRLGYEVTATSSSETGLSLLRADPKAFDLVMTDYMMPGMTGIAFGAAVRELDQDLPMILLSGNLGQVEEREMNEVGFSGCLAKPLDVTRLNETIRTALSVEEVIRSSK